MPPKLPLNSPPDDETTLSLQDWLKLLTSRGVPMRLAMSLAAKTYTAHNTKAKLCRLDANQVNTVVTGRDDRKTVMAAIQAISSGMKVAKKRSRDDDLNRPLGPSNAPTDLPITLEFNEILDPELLIPITVTVNRAPVKAAWAYTVARRMGFDVQEALSMAQVYVHISSLKHALVLGSILDAQQTREAEDEIRELPGEENYRRYPETLHKWKRRGEQEQRPVSVSSAQPWVGILGTKIPVIERPDGTWRAIQKGVVVEPSVAYLYISRALKTFTPHVMGAMKLVADSYTPDEIGRVGLYLYNEFKPDVVEWGQRGSVSVATILEQIKGPLLDNDADQTRPDHDRTEGTSSTGERANADNEPATDGTSPDSQRMVQSVLHPNTKPKVLQSTASGKRAVDVDSDSDLSSVPESDLETKTPSRAPPAKRAKTCAGDRKPRAENPQTLARDQQPQASLDNPQKSSSKRTKATAEEPIAKPQPTEMTVEEYEAMLDDDDIDWTSLP